MIFFFLFRGGTELYHVPKYTPLPGGGGEDHLNVTVEIFPRTFDGFPCFVGTDLNCTWEALYGLFIHCPP